MNTNDFVSTNTMAIIMANRQTGRHTYTQHERYVLLGKIKVIFFTI